jgi:hypothetical protein
MFPDQARGDAMERRFETTLIVDGHGAALQRFSQIQDARSAPAKPLQAISEAPKRQRRVILRDVRDRAGA